MSALSTLIATPITHPAHVEAMRVIYSLTRPWLETRALPERTPIEQQEWWASLDPARVRAWLFSPTAEPWTFVAFSMLTARDGGFETPLFAIHPAHHARGYGRQILAHYLSEARGMLAGSALKSNAAIMRLNALAGWRQLAEDERTVYLYHPANAHPDDARQSEIYDAILEYHNSRSLHEAQP